MHQLCTEMRKKDRLGCLKSPPSPQPKGDWRQVSRNLAFTSYAVSILCRTVRSHNVDIREVQACAAPIFRHIVCERFPLKAVVRFGPQCHRQRGARLPERARTSDAFPRAYLILNATAERAFSSERVTLMMSTKNDASPGTAPSVRRNLGGYQGDR